MADKSPKRPPTEAVPLVTVAARPRSDTVKRSSIAPARVDDTGSIDIQVDGLADVLEPERHPLELGVVGTYGSYEVFGRLAFGGMAEIFLARSTGEAGAVRYVVIKRILPHVATDPQFVQMFLDEARVAIRLNHPNICHIYEFGRQDDTYFIAMEWVNGVSLERLIKKAAEARSAIPVAIVAKVIALIADALHYAHRARDERGQPLGVVHRDVSPQNIMISFDASVKLLDFGVAKATLQGTKTEAGVVKGKFAYMSPEQCTGGNVDARADVFALGICLWEALVGKRLYHRSTEYETMQAVVDDPVPSAWAERPDVPPALEAIVKKALAKKPQDRFQTAGEMSDALEQFLANSREVVSATRITAYLEGAARDDLERGPRVDPSVTTGFSRVRRALPTPPSVEKTVPTVRMPPPEAPEPEKKKKRTHWGTIVLLVLLAASGVWATQVVAPAPHEGATAPHEGATPPTPPPPSGDEHEHAAVTPVAPVADAGGVVGEADPIPNAPPDVQEVDAGVVEEADEDPAPTGDHAHWGSVSVDTRPWSKVYVGTHRLGSTPIDGALVHPGTVRLRMVDADGHTHFHTFHVEAGHTARISLDFTSGGE